MTLEFYEAQYDQAAAAIRTDKEEIASLWRLYKAGEMTEAELRCRTAWLARFSIETVTGPLRLIAGEIEYSPALEEKWEREMLERRASGQ